jgi:hypothetical protein
VGPARLRLGAVFLVDKDAPEEVKDVLRRYYIRYSGPAGMTEQDDMENWNYAQLASSGTIARRQPYNYEMGLGSDRPNYQVPGTVTEGITEENQQAFYRRWSQIMDAESWDSINPAAKPKENGRSHN